MVFALVYLLEGTVWKEVAHVRRPGICGTKGQRQILQAWEVTPPRLLKQRQPAYPAAALAMRMGGKVVLQVVVDEEGRVADVQIVSSTNALFNQSAADAVRQWQYTKPIAHGGQAVACYLTVVVNFQTR